MHLEAWADCSNGTVHLWVYTSSLLFPCSQLISRPVAVDVVVTSAKVFPLNYFCSRPTSSLMRSGSSHLALNIVCTSFHCIKAERVFFHVDNIYRLTNNFVYGCSLAGALLDKVTGYSIVCGGRVHLLSELQVASVKLGLQRTDMAQPVKKCHN